MFVNHDTLSDIAKFKNQRGCASLYINALPEYQQKDFESRLNSFYDEIKRNSSQLAPDQAEKIRKNFFNHYDELLVNFINNKEKTFCVFVSDEFYKLVEVPLRLKERIVINSDFYIQPMLIPLEQFERYAVLVFNRNKARLFNYYLGMLEEEKSIFHDYVMPNINPTRATSFQSFGEKRVANRIEETYNRHLKDIASILMDNFKTYGFTKLIIGSHQEELKSIRGYLHNYLLERLAGEFVANVDEQLPEIEKRAKTTIEKYRISHENKQINDLIAASAHDKAVLGTELVIDALFSDNVRILIMNEDYHTEGYVCPDKHFFTANAIEGNCCALCRKKLVYQPYLEDEIAEYAFTHKAEIFHIFFEKDRFDEHKIGAFLRY